MEKIVLKSISLEIAVNNLRSSVVSMQTAMNYGASVEDVNKHYESIKAQTLRVQQLAGEVRSSCFQNAANYHFQWEE